MNAKHDLWEFTVKNYQERDYYTFLYTNKLQFLYEAELLPYMTDKELREHEAYKRTNYIREKIRFAEMLHINNIMSEQGITPIHFKGFILSYLLFGKKNIRDVGDVDMFVDGEHFDNAHMILRNNGYCAVPGFSQDEEHHIALVKGSVYLELHKSIVKPETRINSDYLVGHTQMLNISGNKILTFDATATLLYMMYHAYSHMETAGQGMTRKYLLEHKYIYFYPYSIRHMFEIALFIEKYKTEIDWDALTDDIKKQRLNMFFRELLIDITLIFPEHIPSSVFDELVSVHYDLKPAFITMTDIFNVKYEESEVNPALLFGKLFNRYWHGQSIMWDEPCTIDIPAVNSPFFYINAVYSLKKEKDCLQVMIRIKKEQCFCQLTERKALLTLINSDGYFGFFELLVNINLKERKVELSNMIIPFREDEFATITADFNSDETEEQLSISVEIPLTVITNGNDLPDEMYADLHFEDENSMSGQYQNMQYNPYSYVKLIIN
ncbi:MAG: hypothetical protein DBX45_09565 [Oscillospiraceae bacterium]|jgi:hypothetical protein|nr:MAG: hypothetical protein DBX45_09565 [Oscillospiraceae bacterium]